MNEDPVQHAREIKQKHKDIKDTKKTLANYLDISMDNLFSILSLNLNTIPGQTSKTTMNLIKKILV